MHDRALIEHTNRNRELVARYGRWLFVQRYSIQTRYLYQKAIEKFISYIDSKSILKTNHFDIREFLANSAAQGSTIKVVHGELYALRGFFDFLNLGGLINWVPPRLVYLRPLPRRHPKIITKPQIDKLFRSARTKHEKAIVETFYGTGCRTGELRTMRIENIDFNARTIRVTGKAGRRIIVFTPVVSRALRQYIGKRISGFVFVKQMPPQRIRPLQAANGDWRCRWRIYDELGRQVSRKSGFIGAWQHKSPRQAFEYFSDLAKNDKIDRPLGIRPMSSSSIQKTVQRMGLRVGVKITPYCFRHTFATHLLDNGAHLRVLQELLGHHSIRSTQIYLHVSKKHLTKTLDDCHPRN
jgi:site-specific recombinase XerD